MRRSWMRHAARDVRTGRFEKSLAAVTAAAAAVTTVEVTIEHFRDRLKAVHAAELGLRFLFGACISLAAGLIGLHWGPTLGGILLAFPAILSASLALIQGKEGPRIADRNAVGAVLGGIGLSGFGAALMLTARPLPAVLSFALAALAWMAVCCVLYVVLVALAPELADRARDTSMTRRRRKSA